MRVRARREKRSWAELADDKKEKKEKGEGEKGRGKKRKKEEEGII